MFFVLKILLLVMLEVGSFCTMFVRKNIFEIRLLRIYVLYIVFLWDNILSLCCIFVLEYSNL